MHVLYLHGFASSAASSKARFFADRLRALDVPVTIPDLNEPDFATLTTTRMIGQTLDAIAQGPAGPIVLIGSSLGAFVAWHTAARLNAAPDPARPLTHLVLLAPALDFGTNRMGLAEAELRRWQQDGWREFFHYGYNEPRRVHYALSEDARQYDSDAARVDTPTLVFQGTRDTLVDPAMVQRFAERHPNVTLHLLDDDHQLLSSLETIWRETAAFLGLDRERP
ncbi:MAG TPA: YqiA/YcfP family alpha/beta fold hydrolase [Vicinamibacterales bacterium]